MIETDKQEITITISGVPEKYSNILALTLNDFLDFSGFDGSVITANDPSDDELSDLISNYTDRLYEMREEVKVKIIEE